MQQNYKESFRGTKIIYILLNSIILELWLSVAYPKH
jgi:hypothetical protein